MKYPVIILLILLPARLCGQSTEAMLEDLLALDENNTEDGAAYEQVADQFSRRINLNHATAAELMATGVLSDVHIAAILDHREKRGVLISIYELQTVNGLDTGTIRKVMPFVFVSPPNEVLDRSLLRRIKKEGESYLMVMTSFIPQKKAGFQPDESGQRKFAGSRPRILTRMRTSRPGDFSVGITAEKDEGERIAWEPGKHQYGFDHVSAHLQLANKGRLRNLIAGDYQCQFGQGLVYGGGLGFGKGAETITSIRRASTGLSPYTSAYESGYFRGIAASVKLLKSLELTGLFSSARRDGSISEGDHEDETVSAIPATGLHRTEKELGGRKTLQEKIMGGAINYTLGALSAGTCVQHLRYGAGLAPAPRLYNKFAFRGETNTNASIYLNYNFHNMAFFSEFAQTMGAGKGYVLGLLASLSKKFELSALHRNYDRDFHPFYSNGFSENSSSQNERGLYLGFRYRPKRTFTFSGYADIFEFPWLRFRVYNPSIGSEVFLRGTWQPSKSTVVFLQVRQEKKQRNTNDDLLVYKSAVFTKSNLWLNFDYAVHPTLKMRTRLQVSRFIQEGKTTHGLLLFHDVTLSLQRFKVTGRYALFDAEDFDNRLYAYESDVWMSYSLPAYYGRGTRQYLVIRFNATRTLSFWLRWAHTRYIDRDAIGSAADTIDGNEKNEVKLEARIHF